MTTQSPPPASTPKIEFIFHGTGTSSSVPNIACITADPITCEACTCGSTLSPQGFKNKRRNTGGIVRIPRDGEHGNKVIVIDVGKTFLAAAHDLFPRYGLRRIDAVILTHPHADAMNGLDDLRGWTLGGSIQKHIDLYASEFTFKEVKKSFPYLVAKEFATGGGDIPEFKWHIIKENEPFRVEGLDFDITPIAVHHGRLFTSEPEVPGNIPTPYDTPGGSGTTTPSLPQPGPSYKPTPLNSSKNGSAESLDSRLAGLVSSAESKLSLGPKYINSSLVSHVRPPPAKIRPYMCFGFVFGDFMVYLSDVSYIPDDAWRTIESAIYTDSGRSDIGGQLEVTLDPKQGPQVRRFKVLVVDCLKLEPHTSHFGILDAVSAARRVNAHKTYMVGFGHRIPHSDWELIGEYLEGKQLDDKAMERPYMLGASRILPPQQEASLWLRPAYDGLRIFANDSEVWEDSMC